MFVVVFAGIDIRRELNQRGCEKTAETRWPARRPKPRGVADRGRRRPDDAHARRRLRVRAAHRLRLRGVGQRRLPNSGGGRDATRGFAGHRHRALRTSSTSRWPPGGQRRRRRTSASQVCSLTHFYLFAFCKKFMAPLQENAFLSSISLSNSGSRFWILKGLFKLNTPLKCSAHVSHPNL